MPESSKGWTIPAIILAASAAAVLLGFGLCGALNNGNGVNSSNAGAGIICFLGGAAGLVIGFIWLIIALVRGSGNK